MLPVPQLVERCRSAGMRMTPQRRAIFEFLEGNTDHPTAEAVFRAVHRRHPGISLATVYNTLDTLERLGELDRLELGGAAERFDPEVRPHQHFHCTRCGRVEDLFGDVPTPAVEGPVGCRVDRVRVQLVGLCATCRGRERPARRRGSSPQ